MTTTKKLTWADGVAGLMILLWVYIALSKTIGYYDFLVRLIRYEMTFPYARFLAIAIPAGSLLAAILLLVGKFQRVGLYLSLGLLFLFSVYLGYAYLFYPVKPCTCMAFITGMEWWHQLLVNLAGMASIFFAVRK